MRSIALRDRRPHTWKRVGVVRHAGPTWPLEPGPTLLGRDHARCAIPLRDQPDTGNLEWLPGALSDLEPAEQARLRRLTLDSFGVSRVHAEVVNAGNTWKLRGKSRFAVYRVRGDTVKATRAGEPSLTMLPGDLLRIGHQLFELRVV